MQRPDGASQHLHSRAYGIQELHEAERIRGFIRLENGTGASEAHNAMAMLKAAYFSFIAALVATPVHLVAGNAQTRTVVLGLLLASAVFAAIGFQRRP